MAIDIAATIFQDILGFTTYPGSPFTGNIFQDIILFFFVPTVFLIIFVYVASAIAVPPEQAKLKLLMSLALYAFILASRMFEAFAIFASQFYIPMLIIIGFFYFVTRHFRRGGQARGGAMAYEGGGHAYSDGEYRHGSGRNVMNPAERGRMQRRLREVNQSLAGLEKRLARAQGSNSRDAEVWARELSNLMQEKRNLEEELRIAFNK